MGDEKVGFVCSKGFPSYCHYELVRYRAPSPTQLEMPIRDTRDRSWKTKEILKIRTCGCYPDRFIWRFEMCGCCNEAEKGKYDDGGDF